MFLDKFKLNNKVALITGGTKEIGLSIVHAFGEAGAQLVLASRNKNGAINELKKTGYEATLVLILPVK